MAFGSDRSRFTDNEFSGKRYKMNAIDSFYNRKKIILFS